MPINLAEPSAALYGVIPQAYAQSLMTPTGDPTVDALNRSQLARMYKHSSTGGYEQLIRENNAAAMQAHELEQQTEADKAWIAQEPNLIKVGAGGTIMPQNSNYLIDQHGIREADAGQLQAQEAENVSKVGTGVNQLSQAGIAPPTDYIRGIFTPPQAKELIQPITPGYVNPGDKAALASAEADMVSANAAKYRAVHNGEGKASGDKTERFYIATPNGDQLLSTKVTSKGVRGGTPAPATNPTGKVEPKYISKNVPGKGLQTFKNPNYKGP